jgi:hypothetical protein
MGKAKPPSLLAICARSNQLPTTALSTFLHGSSRCQHHRYVSYVVLTFIHAQHTPLRQWAGPPCLVEYQRICRCCLLPHCACAHVKRIPPIRRYMNHSSMLRQATGTVHPPTPAPLLHSHADPFCSLHSCGQPDSPDTCPQMNALAECSSAVVVCTVAFETKRRADQSVITVNTVASCPKGPN